VTTTGSSLEPGGDPNAPAVLVIGADGQIGGALAAGLADHGLPALGTTRHPARVGAGRVYLDLEGDPGAWPRPDNIAAAILAAAVTRLDACERDPVATARINVQANLALADHLGARGIPIIFLSSNQVFDGTRPHQKASEPTSPRTVYGRQKAEVEEGLLARGGRASILRLSKVVTPELPLFREWCEALASGSPIRPFRDMVIAPLPVAFVVAVVARMIQQRTAGIVQASGPEDVSYADVALLIARHLGADPRLVQPVDSSETGFPAGFVPRHTTLDTARLKSELALIPPDVSLVLESTFRAPSPMPL
jgi:dTDP-4-dehydrorhamnose reductase